MCPCTHSSSSRTSRTTASSGSSEAGTVGTCCGITPSMIPRTGTPSQRPAGLAGWPRPARREPHVPIDAEDLGALLPELDDAPGPELSGGATFDGLRFAGLDLTGDTTGARFLECELADCGLDD